jgi:hypothetical protein
MMLARVLPGGIFELLTAAWAYALGYSPDELKRMPRRWMSRCGARMSGAGPSGYTADSTPTSAPYSS